MLPLNDRNDDLWKGGPWEQPSAPVCTPPSVHVPVRRRVRPKLRVRRQRRRWPWAVGLLALILALCGGAVVLENTLRPHAFDWGGDPGRWEEQYHQAQYSTEPPAIPAAGPAEGVSLALHEAQGEPLTYTQIYDRALPSFVSILSFGTVSYNTGSGVILTEDGYVLTNAHVVAGAQEVRVQLTDNRTFDAGLVGFNADEDLAVLKIEAAGLTPAQFGRSDDLRCGDPVAALGDSLGYQATFTDGIVSALDRELVLDDGTTMTLIQTSAAINFGNSGGPLLNQYGQVVGITTIKIVSDDGSAESLGFAIPSGRVRYVVNQLLAGEEVRRAVFGFTVSTIPVEGGGLELLEVDRRSDGWTQGLRAGDIVTAVDGRPVTGAQDLSRVRQGLGPGDTVSLTYLRDGVSHTVEMALVDEADLS